jgi:hypothetical protein
MREAVMGAGVVTVNDVLDGHVALAAISRHVDDYAAHARLPGAA